MRIKFKKITFAGIQQAIAGLVLSAFAFTTFAAPYAQASLWEERGAAVKQMKGEGETLVASLPSNALIGGLPRIHSSLSSPVPSQLLPADLNKESVQAFIPETGQPLP